MLSILLGISISRESELFSLKSLPFQTGRTAKAAITGLGAHFLILRATLPF
jgi:hypothetical protein